jgi:hypothetical protein
MGMGMGQAAFVIPFCAYLLFDDDERTSICVDEWTVDVLM